MIEIHVCAGDTVEAEDPLLTLESDKATMDIPAPVAGTVTALRVAVGDSVSQGTVVLDVETAGAAAGRRRRAPPRRAYRRRRHTPTRSPAAAAPAAGPARPPASVPRLRDLHAEVLVLGAGPGGYTAAFRAADLGKKVVHGRPLAGRWAGCASTSAASRPRRCCTRRR